MSGGWPLQPVVYEVDTWPWLTRLSRAAGQPLTLATVPGEAWDALATPGIDAVWLMGVWERSPAGLAIALQDPELRESFRAALPDVTDADVVGSPYCVRRYVVDERLGGPRGVESARNQLARRGLRLVLDYVPNHVAPDHPWTHAHPERFVQGTAEDAQRDPRAWMTVGSAVLAHGRDPYFPPWPDVVQLNAFSSGLRDATVDVLAAIGEQCDGVRCDMAMLMTNDVFGKTWGDHVGTAPAEEFWPEVIGAVHARDPGLVFIAEAYWDMEWQLQHQGFDFCYDKRLYDRLAHEDAGSVRGHLSADLDYQHRLVRFIENHDEPRAAATFAPDRDRAAAVVIATLPGATLWHDGQWEGRRVHLPVFLGRAPDEAVDTALSDFHRRLVAAAAGLRHGEWRLLETTGWPDNTSHENLAAWAWLGDDVRAAVVVDLSDAPAQGRVRLPWQDLAGRGWRLEDPVSGASFERAGDELATEGLYVDLPAWGFHVLVLRPA